MATGTVKWINDSNGFGLTDAPVKLGGLRQGDIMDSRDTRRHIATAALFVTALFVVPSLFAQIHVKVKTPGTAFSVVGSKARINDAADGRHFRAQEITSVDPTTGKKITGPLQFAELKIRGVLRMPPSDSNVPTTRKMQRLAIHFRTSERGPKLSAVKLCNGANCDTLGTDLAGDYSTREVTAPKGATTTSGANVWAFDPPITVGSQSAVVLELQFGGGFDSVVDNGEFVLTAVDADFPTKPITGKSAMSSKDAVITLGRDQSSKPNKGAATFPTSIWPNGKAYLFKGSQYVRYDPKADKVDQGYPQPIAGNWPGFTPAFTAGVDASVVWNSAKVYFFKGNQYLRYDIAADKVDQGYPLPIAGHWPGLWEEHIDAGVVWPNGKAFFFKGSQYIRYDIATDKADPGYPVAIKDGWPGFPPNFAAGIDRAVVWNNGKAYFFKGSEYIRYDIAADKTDEGPLPIAGHWPGLWE